MTDHVLRSELEQVANQWLKLAADADLLDRLKHATHESRDVQSSLNRWRFLSIYS